MQMSGDNGGFMSNLKFQEVGSSLVLYYVEPLRVEYVQAKLGIAWDENEHLIKYDDETIPYELKSIRPVLQNDYSISIRRVFNFSQKDLIDSLSTPEYTMAFRFASIELKGNESYYHIPGRILDSTQDIYITTEEKVSIKLFAVGFDRQTSVFERISSLISSEDSNIIVGGSADNSIPWDVFTDLLEQFPTTAQLKHYGELQITRILGDYLTPKEDYEQIYNNFVQRKIKHINSFDESGPIGTKQINQFRHQSLLEARNVLVHALEENSDQHEDYWQKIILSILPAVYPQYIAVLREAVIPEKISNHGKTNFRRIDHLLIDASGNVDLLEIKSPLGKNNLLMKKTYRDNFIPARELTGGISQIEKYIFYLNHLGLSGEERFSDTCKKRLADNGIDLPDDFKLKFLNPHGLLLIGSCVFTEDEQRDFDLIRRQYSHVVDIVTYDDLLDRIDRIINIKS